MMGVFIFRLSYKIMVIVLIAFSLTVTLCPYIDDPILCIVGSVLGNVNGTSNDSTVATANRITHECIDKDEHRRGTVVVRDRGEIGIIFVLLFQALLFYTPRWAWKRWEAMNYPIITKDVHDKREEEVPDYHNANIDEFGFLVFPPLNVTIVLVQMIFLKVFSSLRKFPSLDIELYERTDPLAKVSLSHCVRCVVDSDEEW
jgi:hypothetical protein